MKNSSTSTIMIAAAVAVIGSQIYLSNQQSRRISALISQQENEARNHAQDRTKLDDLAIKLMDLQKSSGLIKSEYTSAREAQLRAMRDKLDFTLNTQSAENLHVLRDQLDKIINTGDLFKDQTLLAEEAFSLAETAKKYGDTKLAAIYYLSAVNHAPSDFRYLKSYADLILGAPDSRSEDIAQLRSILQLSMYQIPPALITDLLTLDKAVELREAELLARQTPEPEPVDWGSRLDKLATAQTINDSWNDSQRIVGLIENLTEITDSLREEQPGSDLLHRAEAELDQARRVLRTVVLTSTLDSMIKTLNASVTQTEKAVSLIQTAENTLGQLWTSYDSSLPEALRAQIDGYPSAIKQSVEKVAEAQSAAALTKIAHAVNSVMKLMQDKPKKTGTADAPNQRIIEKIKKENDKILSLSNQVFSVTGRDEVGAALQKSQQALATALRWQFDAYQRWSIQQTKLAFDAYTKAGYIKSNNAGYIKSNDEIKRILDVHKLATIDQTLLSPETSKALNDVIAKLMAETNGETAFAMQKSLVETKKIRLEAF